MSELTARGIDGMLSKVRIYDLDESIEASKFPFVVDPDNATSVITKTAKKLGSCGIGEGHDNFLNGILVAFNLTFTNKAWVEAERYHFFDFVSSQSTMHCITKFDLTKQCDDHVDPDILKIVQKKIDYYNLLAYKMRAGEKDATSERVAEAYLDVLYNVPSGFKLTARITTNYRQLKTIYNQRKNHRLPEWRHFCNWMEMYLPYFRELVLGEEEI